MLNWVDSDSKAKRQQLDFVFCRDKTAAEAARAIYGVRTYELF